MELEKHSWKSIRLHVMEARPDFALIIDELSPSKEYPLYLVKYPYGAVILDKGIFQVPNSENRLVPLNHPSIANTLKEQLGYTNTMPMGIVSKNSIETFFSVKERTIPASLYGKGDMISLWRVLEEGDSYHVGPLWSVT